MLLVLYSGASQCLNTGVYENLYHKFPRIGEIDCSLTKLSDSFHRKRSPTLRQHVVVREAIMLY